MLRCALLQACARASLRLLRLLRVPLPRSCLPQHLLPPLLRAHLSSRETLLLLRILLVQVCAARCDSVRCALPLQVLLLSA